MFLLFQIIFNELHVLYSHAISRDVLFLCNVLLYDTDIVLESTILIELFKV